MISCIYMLNEAERLVCTGFAAVPLPATRAAGALKKPVNRGIAATIVAL
jgi:hypothetical protein